VDVYDKARGPGGRLSTKRLEQGWATLGSPFFSAKRDPFRSQLREWARHGWLTPVRGNILQGRATVSWAQAQLQNHYLPNIQPSQLVRQLLGSAQLHTQARVATLRPRTIHSRKWRSEGELRLRDLQRAHPAGYSHARGLAAPA